jgi:hypothetical protein
VRGAARLGGLLRLVPETLRLFRPARGRAGQRRPGRRLLRALSAELLPGQPGGAAAARAGGGPAVLEPPGARVQPAERLLSAVRSERI